MGAGGAIEGTVLGADGRPLEGAEVMAIPWGQEGLEDYGPESSCYRAFGIKEGRVGFSRTGEAGAYRVQGLLAGAYRVEVESPGLSPPPEKETTVRVGESARIDFLFPAGGALCG